MKKTPIFTCSGNATTGVDYTVTVQNVPVGFYGDLVVDPSDLDNVASKADFCDWLENQLYLNVMCDLPLSVVKEIDGVDETLTYVSGNVNGHAQNITASFDQSTDELSVTCDIVFNYGLLVYHSATQGADISVTGVTAHYTAIGVVSE